MIKLRSKSACLIVLFVFMGCSQIQIPFFGKSSEQLNETEETVKSNDGKAVSSEFVKKGRVIDAAQLQQSKNLAIIPFKAGVNAEATYELDRAALMLVKGVSDAFKNETSSKREHFKILTAENADTADLIVKGHITTLGGPSKFSRWIMFNRKKRIDVEGKIIDAQTNATVSTFSDQSSTRSKSENYDDLGYRVGVNIGQFILSSIE